VLRGGDVSTDELWAAFLATRSAGARAALMEAYLPLVAGVAQALSRRLPPLVEVGDLESAGVVGLAESIEGFDPARDVKFGTYAQRRVRGAMVDWLRETDWVPRLTRFRARWFQRAGDYLAAQFGRPPGREELVGWLKEFGPEYELAARGAASVASLSRKWFETDSGRDVREVDLVADERCADPADRQARREMLAALTEGMSRRERLIVRLYYFEDLTMKEIAGVLGVTESRVSQAHAALLPRIRSRFSRRELEELLAAG
jgi:RNA polymerase sigma factor FliA